MLSDQGTLHHLDWAQEQRAQAVAEQRVREACTRLWYWREAMTPMHGSKRVRLAQVVVREQEVYQRLCPEWQSAYEQVDARLRQVMWARSMVECVNNVVRMP